MKKAILKKGKEAAILRKHPWIFSGAIEKMDAGCRPGDLVQVFDFHNQWICSGHVGDGSIAVRILSFEDQKIDQSFWNNRIENCFNLRIELGFGPETNTTAFRLVHGEGDFLPGLIVDIYENTAVIQAHTEGMFQNIEKISEAIQSKMPFIQCIYKKCSAALHRPEIEDGFILGSQDEVVCLENGLKFNVNWVTGQKTGFFLDQRDNRNLLRHFSSGKSVLNTFSYSGGFSVAAMAGGAKNVISVDISKIAVDLCSENIALNSFSNGHQSVQADVMDYLRTEPELFDIVVLDPPAFAKSLNKKHAATMGYKRLNALGLQKVKPGGLLFTFSCSQVVDEQLFANTVTAAAIEIGRNCRILYRLGQGADHPVNIFHPEGHYLKGLVIKVD